MVMICGIARVAKLEGAVVDNAMFYLALTFMHHRGPDEDGTVLIESATGRFEERSGPDTPRELNLVDLRAITKLETDILLGNKVVNHRPLTQGPPASKE